MHPKPGRHEIETFCRRYDNDRLYLAYAWGLRGLAVVCLLLFLLWPLGWARSRHWEAARTGHQIRVEEDIRFEFFGYRVGDEAYALRDHYFGGNPPAIFGRPDAARAPVVFYDPADPAAHVVHRHPSWMTLLLPVLAAGAWAGARRFRAAVSEEMP